MKNYEQYVSPAGSRRKRIALLLNRHTSITASKAATAKYHSQEEDEVTERRAKREKVLGK